MERDVKQGKGRYFKKDQKILSTIKLSTFNLREIVRSGVVSHDNLRNSVIAAENHRPEDLLAAVQPHKTMNKELRDESQIRPLLIPLDFTMDWERQRDRAAKGGSGRVEDEEDALELEIEFQRMKTAGQDRSEASGELSSKPEQKGQAIKVPTQPSGTQQPHELEENIKSKIAGLPGSSLHTASHEDGSEREIPTHYRTQNDKLDELGKVLIDFAEHQEPDEHAGVHLRKTTPKNQDQANLESRSELEPLDEPKTDFIPMGQTTVVPGESSPTAEMQAISDYHRQVDQRRADPEEVNRLYEEAKHRGYEDGFAVGEQKASIQGLQSIKEAMQKLDLMALKLKTVQREALLQSTDNFREITQAIAESLISRELSYDPQALASLFVSAVEANVNDDDFTLFVSARDFEELSGLPSFSLKPKMKVDASLDAGDFRIETKLSSVDGRLSKSIAELMQRIELEPTLSALSKAG